MTENTETHFEMQVSRKGEFTDCWNEKLTGLRYRDVNIPEPKTNTEAIELAKEIVEFFNSSLRPDETERKVVCVQRVETKVIDLMELDFNED